MPSSSVGLRMMLMLGRPEFWLWAFALTLMVVLTYFLRHTGSVIGLTEVKR